MFEIKQIDSQVFGGGDGLAINRHSVRTYSVDILDEHNYSQDVDGNKKPIHYEIILDKTLDADPPYYELYFFLRVPSVCPEYICVEGIEAWGDGWSWARAKEAAFAAIRDTFKGGN